MTADRFSMKEWKPEQLFDKIQRLEEARNLIEDEKAPLKARKKEIEIELTELNVKLKGLAFEEKSHNDINSKRGVFVKEKSLIELKLSDLKQKQNKINADIESTKIILKKTSSNAIKYHLLELRDRYLSFSADTTRVSSMRAMSSKFVEEIQSLLKYIP